MSTPNPSPNPPDSYEPSGFTWKFWTAIGLLFSLIIFSAFLFRSCWSSRDEIRPEDLADPSLDFDTPWPSRNYIIENGRTYEQGSIPFAPGTEVIFPVTHNAKEERVVRTDGPDGPITLLIEKQRTEHSHPGRTLRLRDLRAQLKAWKRQVGTTLVIDVDSGSRGPHGGTTTRAVLIVPRGTQVRQERDGFHLRGSAEEARAAGWEELSLQPMPKSQWPLPINRPDESWRQHPDFK